MQLCPAELWNGQVQPILHLRYSLAHCGVWLVLDNILLIMQRGWRPAHVHPEELFLLVRLRLDNHWLVGLDLYGEVRGPDQLHLSPQHDTDSIVVHWRPLFFTDDLFHAGRLQKWCSELVWIWEDLAEEGNGGVHRGVYRPLCECESLHRVRLPQTNAEGHCPRNRRRGDHGNWLRCGDQGTAAAWERRRV